MPVVFRYNGIRFFFYSNEGDPREPVHIHAQALLMEAVDQNRELIERRWNEHFS
ncbi:hypothetical protein OKW49_008185 [Paraburkholderia youngii]|uniref:DUF4160 domain-containing protein n=1 Tax=Paraburkholderia youngii TaxID=2782701 RepID=UPI003D22395D